MGELDLFGPSQTTAYLINRDAKGKIRCVLVNYYKEDEYWVIHRETYQYGGTHTQQPNIIITQGKQKRDASAQTELRFNALVKEYKDKGYKEIDRPAEDYSLTELDSKLPKYNTDSNGFKKHMLAKQSEKVKQASIDKVPFWYASRKIDGVRCSFYWDGNRIRSASRGGGDYDYATMHFTHNKTLIEFFKRHPKFILDGELYKHGKSLQQISGAARMEKNAVDCDWLEFYIYDNMLEGMTFRDRLETLHTIKRELNLGFDPNRSWEEGELQMQMVPQERVSGWDNILKLHDQYVSEGWEGLVIRNPDKVYGFGRRTNDMIKVKKYKDAEFRITGISEGLRDEDMCFTLETAEGIPFKAKPMGSREIKNQYRKDLPKLIGKYATVKYFYLSDEGTPLQPVLKAIRDYD
jgi:DNA ligase-1